ncbi:MAG: HEAT repeat domain-containing protein [Chloroflexota bacterium]|nr:HEAT repeat domain-containing protein [Chloroflexota bacterium]
MKYRIVSALAIGMGVFLLFFAVSAFWIGYEVRSQCRNATETYSGDCVAALVQLLDDEGNGFRERNNAIWALGQLGDSRALPALQRYYTGDIPPREPIDETISQYELKKAINLTSGGVNAVAWLWRPWLPKEEEAQKEVRDTTVVVAQKADPYYALAEKIAQEEDLELLEEFTDVLELRPKHVILVAAPENLTAERLLGIGRVYKEANYYPAVGIISGSTPEKAEQLWARRDLAKANASYIGGDVDILQHVFEPTIVDISGGANREISLNRANLVEALRQADYFYYVRHTGPRDWSWNEQYGQWTEDDQLRAEHIPELKPVVIYSPTCRPFRPWVEDSIALAFVDKGASAFLGYLDTPHSDVAMRHGQSVPGLTSWREFPLGIVAQVQNRMATKYVFDLPQLFMLGDPRIYLSEERPYRVSADALLENGRRAITGESDVNGILSVKIDGGAKYGFLSIRGLTSVSERDLFYNHRLHTLDLGVDKYILFPHDGGRFDITLAERAPWGWRWSDALWDAFDYAWVVMWLSTYADSNPQTNLVALAFFAGILLYKVVRQKKPLASYSKVFLFALAYAVVRLAYYLLRMDVYSVSPNLVDYSAWRVAVGSAGVFACVAGGLIIMKDSRRVWVKALGLLLAVSRELWMAGFYLVFITALNTIRPITGNTNLWQLSYDTLWLSLIVLVFEALLFYAVYRYLASPEEPTPA